MQTKKELKEQLLQDIEMVRRRRQSLIANGSVEYFKNLRDLRDEEQYLLAQYHRLTYINLASREDNNQWGYPYQEEDDDREYSSR